MAENSDQEKTEEPTAKRLKEAREKGNVSKSQELTSVILLTVSSVTLYALGGWMYEHISSMFEQFFRNASDPINNFDAALFYLKDAFGYTIILIAPLLGVVATFAIIANIMQTGLLFSTKSIAFKGEKLNPLKGFKRMFSAKSVVELVKGISKICIVGFVIWFTIESELESFMDMILMSIGGILMKSGSFIFLLVTRILMALLFLSAADAAYQRYEWKKGLKMSKQEIKDEYKQMEGDPRLKSQRRAFGIKLSRQKRLDHSVLSADVVVTNPTHYAVALRYDPKDDEAPMILVKGMRKRALRIKELAAHYEIPIVENPPLARALYAGAEEEQFIPPDLYEAVAELLAYVYQLKEKNKVA